MWRLNRHADMITVHTICHKTRIRCRIFFQFFLRHIFLQCFGHVIGVLLFSLDVFSAFFLYVIWLFAEKQVSGGFGLTSVLVIFRTLDSSSFCMGKTFDLLLNSSRSLPFTSSVVRSSSGLVSSAVISVP